MSTNPSDPIVVLGASGAQGAPVAQQLLAAGRAVRAVGQTAAKLVPLGEAGAEAHPLDLADDAALDRAFAGAGGAFVHLPFVPVEALQQRWAAAVGAALVRCGVPIAVFTSSGPVPSAATGVVTVDSKRAAEEELRASGAPIVFLRPAIYLGNLAAPFSAPTVVDADELRYPPFAPHVAMPYISVEDQAGMVLAALERPDLIGRTLPIGAQLTGEDLAAGLSEALGRSIGHRPYTPLELGDAVRPMMGDQVAQILAADYTALGERSPALGLDAETGASHRELGVHPTDVAVWARRQDWEGAAAFARSHG